uniref:Cytochrome P450 n=1 Tax=Ditylum brightwellii TaxID=49249 RepID=A0A7S2EF90_9STRA|mmetsp:Transcript_27788/g.41341  ORF Transcript_27788/g.41341 Transcript_27788/m.41341 type:complete len:552 (+) Transcript_27788:14-1669(+)
MVLSMLLALLALVTIGFAAFLLYLKRKHSKSPLPGLPTPPNPQWLIGHMEDRTIPLDESLKKICLQHANASGVTAMWYFDTSCATVIRYQDARAILQSTPARMNMPGLVKKQLQMLTGPNNILLLEGKEWKYHRTAIMKALNRETLEKSHVISVEAAFQLCDALEERIQSSLGDKIEVELYSLLQLLTMDIFGLAGFDFAFHNSRNLQWHPVAAKFQFMKDEYERRMNNPMTGYFFGLPTKHNRDHAQANKMVRSFIEGIVEERSAQKELGGDFLGNLLRAREDLKEASSSKMDGKSHDSIEDTMTDVILTLLFAGQDTTALAITYAILEIARNPRVNKSIQEEINLVWKTQEEGNEEGNTSLPDPAALVYCSAVITEALRLYPSLPGFVRTLTKPVKVGEGSEEYTLPIDTYTYIPFWLIHRDERNFERATDFLPERWVKKNSEGKWEERDAAKGKKQSDQQAVSDEKKVCDADSVVQVGAGNKNAFFAFSTGGRSCAGEKFAKLETVLVLASILKKLDFSWKEGWDLKVMHASTGQKPSDMVPIMVSVR